MPAVVLMAWGAFGKMPALGDFFRMGVAADFVSAWDGWLQSMILGGKSALGPAWTEAYFSAPIWRFALAPGVAGAGAVAGVLMPSVDRVGRQFPLTLVAPVSGDPVLGGPMAILAGPHALWAAVEDLALDCLEDGMTRDTLEARLAALPDLVAPPGLVTPQGAVTLAQGAGIEGALAALAARPVAVGFACEVEGVGRLLLSPTLPGPDMARGLFDMAQFQAAQFQVAPFDMADFDVAPFDMAEIGGADPDMADPGMADFEAAEVPTAEIAQEGGLP
ncbi:type VI secretion system-associated protein TagF [Rhodobacter sp. KR11]|uniref:type VI secretion system-associated protein TagF n=1 Tax=Rhodobacter sp. KR11 TaxID=2974588 RepID=UPI002221A1E3|nr:type VI secretion system-associated protein TagF [Rhodobacter sp. KR11]MCW1917926.1 type VI secretion system-associated protein TagF [Rhodobacter sp. KR11]